jgi:hypothetical protein
MLEMLPEGDPQRAAYKQRLSSVQTRYSEAWFAKTKTTMSAAGEAYDKIGHVTLMR